ncbi:unnamed protein product [Urochloa humidicola]
MAVTGGNGGRGPWSYREHTGISSSYTISSTSGTVSTGYTSNGSHVSWISMEAARHFQGMEEDAEEFVQPANKKSRKEREKQHTELAKEFFGAPSAKCSNKGADMSVLEKWFEKLGVGWVLHVADGAAAGRLEQPLDVSSWIRALPEIVDTFTASLSSGHGGHSYPSPKERLTPSFPQPASPPPPSPTPQPAAAAPPADHRPLPSALPFLIRRSSSPPSPSGVQSCQANGAAAPPGPPPPAEPPIVFIGHSSTKEEGPVAEESEQQDNMTDHVQFASFITQHAMLKMLAFVDLIDAPNLNITCDVSTIHRVAPPYQKLYSMLRVRNALFIDLSCYPPPSAQGERIQKKVAMLLSAKKRKVSDAIWNTMEEIRNGILESVGDSDDSSGTQTPQDSSRIHKATKSVISYITFLKPHYLLVDQVVSEAASLGKHAPQVRVGRPLDILTAEMASCVQEKLASKSEKFPDQSLRFLFSSLIMRYTSYCSESYEAALTGKVDGYMESYIQVSWAPVLACLFNPMPLRFFGKNYSTLLKFESQFQKTYNTQKLWNVPDPKLRKMLREAVIEKIVPGYTKYIEDNKATNPKFTPRNLEEMLQELFEG